MRSRFRRSPIFSAYDCSDIKEPAHCNAQMNCYYDYDEKACRSKRSPTFIPRSPYYNMNLPFGIVRDVNRLLYGDSLRLVEYYPHHPEYILKNIVTAPESEIVELLNYLPDVHDWFLQEIFNRLHQRLSYSTLQTIAGLSGNYPFISLILDASREMNHRESEWNHDYINRIMANAAAGGHLDIVERMIELGTARDELDFDYAMEFAAESGHLEIVERMVELGATKFSDALDAAALGGHLDVVERILELGNARRYRFRGFQDALDAAALSGNSEIVERMLDLTRDNEEFLDLETPMENAASRGHTEIVERMIELGATEVLDAFYAAALNGHLQLMERMMVHFNVAEFDAGLQLGLDAASSGHLEIVDRMIELARARGVELDFDRPMLNAANVGHLEILERMIELGATDFVTALSIASEKGHDEIVERLRELV